MERRLKSLLLLPPPTALRSEMRLFRVSEPSLLVKTHSPRLCLKTEVKMYTRDKSQFADLENAMFN